MKLEKGKLFWKSEATTRKVCCIRWEEQGIEYYSFLREKKQAGYHQVIISSEIFMDFLRFAVVQEGYSLIDIEFMEDDEDYVYRIQTLISQLQTNPAYFAILIDELRDIAEKSSIEIKRIRLKSRINNVAMQFFIQSNGLIGVNQEAFQLMTERVNTFLERCLFG